MGHAMILRYGTRYDFNVMILCYCIITLRLFMVSYRWTVNCDVEL